MRSFVKRCLLIATFYLLHYSPSVWTQAMPSQRPSPDADVDRTVHLEGERISLPLVIVKGYPFLQGEINGVSGKLLFDIGEEASFALNSHRVMPANARAIGMGYFGSGQTFSVYRFPLVDSLKLKGGPKYTSIANVRGNPGLPLEQHITSDFIGWLGLGWFDGYILELDYRKARVTFYKDDPSPQRKSSGINAELGHNRIVQVIRFQNVGHRNVPTASVYIGTHPLVATFDTGSHNVLWLNSEMRDKLKAEGLIVENGKDSFELTSIVIDNHRIELNSHVEVRVDQAGVSRELGFPSAPIVTLGYEFLSQYKTVWNYRDSTLTLLLP